MAKMKKSSLNYTILPAVFAVLMGGGGIAHAQSINYTALEELFGEPVTTSATGKPQRAAEAPVAMEIISADDIRRSGAKDLAELLRGVSGVSVMQTTRQQYDVNIRGYNQPYSSRLLVLVNGRQVYLDDYGYTNWSAIPVQLEEIRQIEVVKGPNSALFGFNAASGVINIVTANPLYDQTSTAGISAGTDRYHSAHYVQTVKIQDKAGVRISAGGSKADEFNRGVNGLDPASAFIDPSKAALNVDGVIQVTPKSQVRVEVSGSATRQTEMTPLFFLSGTEYKTGSAKVGYEADTKIGLVKATVYQNWLGVDYSGSNAGDFDIDNRVLVAQAEDTFKVGADHAFRIQGEYRRNVLEGDMLSPGASLAYAVYALSGMWGWTLLDNLEWTNSVRMDWLNMNHSGAFNASSPYTDADYNQSISEPSYNSGLVWRATQDDTFRLSTARGVKIPSLLNYGMEFVFGPVLFVGNPTLSPTIVTNYEVGWDRAVKLIRGMLKTSIFYQTTEDVVAEGVNFIVPNIFQQDNIGDSSMVGAEIGLSGKIGAYWDWDANYTIQKINDDFSVNAGGAPYAVAANFEDSNPTHMLNAHLGYQNGSWEADTYAYLVSSFHNFEPNGAGAYDLNGVSSFGSLSGRVGYALDESTTVALSGQEIQAVGGQRTTGPDVERRVYLSLEREFGNP